MRIGTRGSALALAQAELVAQLLAETGMLAEGECRPASVAHLAESAPHESPLMELVTIATAGDRGSGGGGRNAGDPAANGSGGDKSRWVLDLERALSAGEIDLAVHSAKDVPGELADGLVLLGAPARAAAEDVLCTAHAMSCFSDAHQPAALDELPPGARVGTSSVRRTAQLRAAREDLRVVTVRGNVDTRLRKLGEGGFDALVLARAGLQRLGREQEIAAVLDPARFVPSPGQGTLALEGRAGDTRTRAAVEAITDAKTFACLQAERAVAQALDASCNTPLGVHAVDGGCGCLQLRAWVGLPDGSAWVSDELLGGFYDPEQLGGRVAERLRSAGAGELLRQAEDLAVEHA
ncbi:MAG TPA: hydroxymethylbilane synthase [Solirubrobacteraceae bacterium]|nr:hydroxymethylbilane synthase [Solirubrobacteraceae bacterium]